MTQSESARGRTAMALTAVPPGTAALAGAPWQVVVGVSVASMLVGVLSTVFPQNSRDRLLWWRDRRRYQEKARQHRGRATIAPTAAERQSRIG
ncbi:hypothetical protein ABT168_04035 [Streptomyces sp. NPDC001793]|uniref:hypothetical protein n=1 Tax=Streptomyces sp. NPDC001793 TaxID=3154657 RepID=UPI0033192239